MGSYDHGRLVASTTAACMTAAWHEQGGAGAAAAGSCVGEWLRLVLALLISGIVVGVVKHLSLEDGFALLHVQQQHA
jgi:hypothetical protein